MVINLYKEIKNQTTEIINELLALESVKAGQLIAVGCSSSEIIGNKIGKGSSPEAAKAVVEVMLPLLNEKGILLAAQCCEHLNRALVVERELANKLMIAGDLKNALVLITRNGKAGDMQTTYSMDILPADHPVFKPDMIPADFSAFNNFNIARHSYWEKTAEEIQAYLTTGQFPERANTQSTNTVANVAAAAAYAAPQTGGYVAPTTTVAPVPSTPTIATPGVNTAIPAAAPATPAATPAGVAPNRNFSGFSF